MGKCARFHKKIVNLHHKTENKMKRTTTFRYIIFLLLCLFSYNSLASITVHSRFLSSENGIQANYIRNIVQDPQGYIWMGTTNGLIRYDGYSAYLITPGNAPNRKLMKDARILSIRLWKDRYILILSRGNKYCCYDIIKDEFINYEVDYNRIFKQNQDTDNRGNKFRTTPEGDIWVTFAKTKETLHLTGIYSKELVKLNGSPRYSIVTDKDGVVWISTYGNGLFAHDPKTKITTHFLNNGINISPIQTNYLIKLYEDRAGNIWVCQENMGVAIISKQKINIKSVYFTTSERLDHTNSIHLLSRAGESIYIGNRYNGLKRADGNLRSMETIAMVEDDVVAVCKDLQGRVWAGMRESGVYVDGRYFRHQEGDDTSLTAGKISDIICDQKGRVWISTFEGGVNLAVPDGKRGYTFRHFFTGKHAIEHPRKMLTDRHGYMWLCSDKGVYVFQPDQLMAHADAYLHYDIQTRPDESNEAHCIAECSENHIVIGTAGSGIVNFDNSRPEHARLLKRYTTDDGLPNNNVQQIIADRDGNIWSGTDKGLARYDIKTRKIMSLEPANTTLGNMFIENAACLLDDGRIAFGSRHGITIIDPKTVTTSKPLFQLHITDIDINGVSVHEMEDRNLATVMDGGQGIRLAYNENSLVFHFSDFEYDEALTTKYTYRLEGYDKEWSPMSAYNFATYKNLPPGKYSFEVKAQNAYGEWNGTVIKMAVVVRPPFWLSWWAYLIYIIIAGIIAFLIYRYLKRIEELRMKIKVENQLTEFKVRFFTNISHEFRTPLTIIKGAMENINALDSVPSKMKQPMSSMNKSVERMMRLVNQLLEFRKMQENRLQLAVEETDIVAFVKDIWLTFSQTADNKRINYVFLPFAHHYTMFVDRNFVDKIAYNLISNAFKYTPNRGSITCRITHSEEERHISIVVEDTGVGIPKEKQKDLFTPFNQSTMLHDSIGIGLHLTHELVMVHHGEIAYRENPHGGSIFTVSLPTDPSVYSEKDFITESVKLLQGKEDTEGGSVPVDYKEMAPNPMNDRHVLIVEDEDEVREFLQHELQRYFVCHYAVDGNDALVKISEQKPDLIISDIMMPVMNGIQLTEKIRHDNEIADIPIILLTALSDEKHIVKGLKYGADAYIEKPFSIPVLIAKCRQLIEQRDKLRSHYATETMSNVEPQEIIVNEQDKRFKERLDVWLNSNFHKSNLDVDTFAESMGYGRTTFYKKVKKIMGMTPNDYLKAMRMNKAAELLMNDTLTVAEISYKVGFEDPYYFSKSFKNYFGVSPTQYRRGEKPKHE